MKMKDSINKELSSIQNTTAQITPFNKLKDGNQNSFFGKPGIKDIIFYLLDCFTISHCCAVIGKVG